MRVLALILTALLLGACAGQYCADDPHGLDPPGWGSTIPEPHAPFPQ
ncbi:hypothetical protein [Phenylobacterium sp.]|nr:hypothetical protein [Phenylobacterium sp.]